MSTTALSLASAGVLLACGAWLSCAIVGLLAARSVLRLATAFGGGLGFTGELLLLVGEEALGISCVRGGGVLVALALLLAGRRSLRLRGVLLRLSGGALLLGLVLSAATTATAATAERIEPRSLVHGAFAAGVCLLCLSLARQSVLSKVVAAVVGAVLVATIGASAAAGAQASSSLEAQQRAGADAVLAVQERSLAALQGSAAQLASALASCEPAARCTPLLRELDQRAESSALIVEETTARSYPGTALDSRRLGLVASQPEVQAIVRARAGEPRTGTALLLLPDGDKLVLAVAGVRQRGLDEAVVYLVEVGTPYLERAVEGSPYTLRIRGEGLESATSTFEPRSVLAQTPLTLRGGESVVLEAGVPASAGAPAQQVVRDVALLGAGVLLLSSVLALALGAQTARRLRSLTYEVLQAPSRIRSGTIDTGERERAGRDEVATLDEAFGEMVGALALQQRELEARVESEAAVRSRLAATLESLSDAVLTLDEHSVIRQANPAAEGLWEEAGGDAVLVGAGAEELIALDGPSGGLDLVLGELQRGARASWSGRGVLGGTIPVELRIGRLSGADAGTVLVARDLRGAEEVERMKTEFLSNISHELRTPLTPITGYVSILRRRPELDAAKRESFLEVISDSSVRLKRVVDLLVDVASLDANRVELEPREVELNGLAEEIAQAWRQHPAGRGRSIEVRPARRRVRVHTDPRWLTKAVDELVDNALKYSEASESVVIEVQQRREHAVIHVVDTGAGIDTDLREQLFGAFTQADGSATRASGGLGLGLSFVRRVAEELGCGLVVRSSPGAGSRFSLEIRR